MLKVLCVPIFQDNYVWVLTNTEAKQAIVVDPGDGNTVEQFLRNKGLELCAILITHNHWDHVQGVEHLKNRYGCEVYGPDSCEGSWVTHALTGGDQLSLLGIMIEVMALPGHTQDHLGFLCNRHLRPHLFCGDVLFACGCGRLLGGSAQQMLDSIEQIKQLPFHTLIYPAHEYSMSNLSFVKHCDRNNKYISDVEQMFVKRLEDNLPTLPTSLDIELLVNPFLRTADEGIQNFLRMSLGVQTKSELETFTLLRELKDSF